MLTVLRMVPSQIVIDPVSVEQHLPQSVLAVYYYDAGEAAWRDEFVAVHSRFLREYGLSRHQFPLLQYHIGGGNAWQPGSPYFTCVAC